VKTRLPRPVWLLGWVSFFTDLASEAIYPLLPLFLSAVLGAGAMALGLIEGAAEAANSLLKILSGHYSDRWRVRKPIVLGGYALSSLVRPLIAFVTVWPQVFVLRFIDRLGKGIRGAPRDAMLADLAPPGMRGRVFGANRAMDHAGAVAGPLAASLFLWLYPGDLRTLFALSVIPGVIVVAILVMVPEVKRAGEDARATPGGAAPTSAPLPSGFYRLLGVILLFTLGNSTDAFLLLRLSQLGVSPAGIPLVWAALHVVKSAGSAAGGALSDRVGRRVMIASGWVLYAAVYAGFAFVQAPSALVAIFLAYGVYYGLSESPEKALITDLVPAERRGFAFGLYNAALGLGSLLASVVFGLVWTAAGPAAAFLLGAALALVASVALLTVGAPRSRAIL
jgi:MFS family permease